MADHGHRRSAVTRNVANAAAVWLSALASLASLAAAQEPNPEAPPAAAAPSRSAQVEEIVVTARRRAEMLEDTPISVTALGEATLREAGVTRLDEIQTLVPNLQFLPGTDNQATNIIIRGVGTSVPGVVSFDPGVGIYVDGILLPRAQGQLIDLIDAQQVEVLRGPQGTLFGKNTVGGAINMTTVKPTEDLEAFALVRPGNQESLFTRAILNIPVRLGWFEDKLFTRFAMSSTNSDGYVWNQGQDTFYGDRNSIGFLQSVRFLPIEDLTIDVSGTWSRDHNHGRGGQCVFVQETALGSILPGYYDACRRSRPFSVSTNESQISDLTSYGVWGTIAYDVGALGLLDGLVVKSISSWRRQRQRARLDFDATEFPAIKTSDVGGSPTDGFPSQAKQVSTELQLNGNAWDGRIDFVAGAFGFWEDASDPQTLTLAPGFIGLVNLNLRESDNQDWALYGQATAAVTEWLSLTAGVRYTEEETGIHAVNSDPTQPDQPPSTDLSSSARFSAWTPMASVAVTLPSDWLEPAGVDHLMTYFTYSQGFRGGGFDGTLNPNISSLEPFAPEFLDSFEWGAKTIALEQRATLNVSVFYVDYRDIQVSSIQDDPDSPTGFIFTTQNAAKATTHGAEIELLALPIDGLQMNGSVGLLYSEYDEFIGVNNVTGDPIDRAGQRFSGVPELQTHVAVQYSHAVDLGDSGWLEGWVTPRVEWYYQSSMFLLGPEVPEATQRGYNLLHARLSYDFFDDRAQVALWAKNLTDTAYFDFALPSVSSFGTANRFFAQDRTYGAELSYRF
jgi:iron complex outermembrane receptor protein